MSGAHAIMHGEGRIPESEYRFFFVTNVAYLFGFVAHAIFLTVFSLLGIPEMVLHNVASCFVFFVAILANQRRRYRLAMSLAFSEVLVHAVLAVVFVGQASGFQYYVFVAVPLIFFVTVVPGWVRFVMALVAFLVYASISYFLRGEPVHAVDTWVLYIIRGGNIAGVVAGFSFIGYWYGRINQTAEAALYAERNKLREQNERMQSELEMARRIQLQLVPATGPVKGLAFQYQPMTIIGGDFYDFVTFAGRPEEVGLFISDVSGHGVPAALIASMLKSTLLQSVDILDDPPRLMGRLNDTLVSKTNDNFVTAFYGICNLETGEMRFCNAGHNTPWVIAKESVFPLESGRPGLPLAIFHNAHLAERGREYQVEQTFLPLDSHILLYTDGLTETRGMDGREYGDYRLAEVLMLHRHEPAGEIVSALAGDLVRFHGAGHFEDDVCIVCLSVGQPAVGRE